MTGNKNIVSKISFDKNEIHAVLCFGLLIIIIYVIIISADDVNE